MKKILPLISFILFLVTNCATNSIKLIPPPSPNRMGMIKKFSQHLKDESEEIANDYIRALKAEREGDKELACNLFTGLYKHKGFPIREVALIHTLSDCIFSEESLIKIWTKTSIPNYLREAYTEQSLKLATEKNIFLFEAQFSFDLISFRNIPAEKIQLLKRSISIASKINDTTKFNFYTERLKNISPLHNEEINKETIYIIAKDFEKNHKFDKARSLYQKIISEDFSIEEKIKAYNSLRISYKIERNLKTFISESYNMEKFLKSLSEKNPGDQKIIESWIDSKISLTKAVWTNNQNKEAKQILNELDKTKLGTSNQLAHVQLIYGLLFLESKDNIKAIKHFENASNYKITDPELLENIQWAIVWNNYLLKRYPSVVFYTDQFIKKSNNQNFISKLNYWKSKSLTNIGKTNQANEVLVMLANSDPFGYYGIISTIDLKKPLSPIPQMLEEKKLTGLPTLDWLLAVEENKFSQKYLKEIDSQFKTFSERESAMPLYFQTEWFQGGMRQIYNFKSSSRNDLTKKYINIIFPTPFLESVEKYNNKYSVPKELIWGISRQESAFIPSERSWANAFGLMQLIPEKAIALSRKYNIPYENYNDLYNPEINIEMGTALLRDLREKYNGKFVQTVAAYNASESAIATWMKERFNGDYFEFVESIPYEETRNYIKLVFRNYMTYKRILSKEDFIIDKDFFEKNFN